jgi:hypothetical protein
VKLLEALLPPLSALYPALALPADPDNGSDSTKPPEQPHLASLLNIAALAFRDRGDFAKVGHPVPGDVASPRVSR